MSFGKGSNTTSTQSSANPAAMGAYYNLLNQAGNVAQTPYQAYGGQGVAPVNQQQQAGIGNINQYAMAAQPMIGQAAQYTMQAAQPLSSGQIQQYQSPYTQDVVNATQAQFNNQNAQQQNQLVGNAAAQGALGGDRVGVAQAQLAGQQNLSEAPTIAGLENTGYNQAVQVAMQQQQNLGNQAYALGAEGTAGQNAALQGAGAQVGAGTLEQQTQQAQDAYNYQQYMQQMAYPFATTQWLAGIDTGVGSQMGGTSQTTGPAPNPWGQMLGAGLGAFAAFANRGGRIKGYDGGGGVYGSTGMPYSGGLGWIPSINITPGQGIPKAPSLPSQQQQNPLQTAKQVQGLANGHSGDSFLNEMFGSDPSYGGGDILAGDTFGGSSSVPLPGLDASDYGFARGGTPVRAGLGMSSFLPRRHFADGGDTGLVPDSWSSSPAVTYAIDPDTQTAPVAQPTAGVSAPPVPSTPPDATAPANVPRGIRNNNPGNIEDGQFAQTQPGYQGSDGRFAIFESPQAGLAASSNLLSSYGNKGINTISGIVNRWAPAADNNNTAAYAAAVSKATGIPPSQPVDMSDPAVRSKIATAMGQFENGTGGPPTEKMLAQNYNRAAGLGDNASLPANATPTQGVGIQPQHQFGLGLLSPDMKQSLLAAGLGMMASRSPFLGVGIGEGGLQGLQTYSALQQQHQAQQHQQQDLDLKVQQLNQQAKAEQDKIALATKAQTFAQTGISAAEQAKLDLDKSKFNYEQNKGVNLPPGGTLVNPGTGKVIATNESGLMTDPAIDMIVDRIHAGDPSALTNLGRGAQTGVNLTRIQNRLAERAQADGWSGADLAAARANFTSQAAAASTAAKREANVEASVEEAKNTFPLAAQASAALPRSDWVPLNKLEQMIQSGTSDPRYITYSTALQGAMTAYAQAMSRTGTNSVYAQQAAHDLLSRATGHEGIVAALDQMQREMQAAQVAPETVRQAILGRISGKGTAAPTSMPPAQQPAAVPPPQERVAGQTYSTPKGQMKWTGTGWVPAQ